MSGFLDELLPAFGTGDGNLTLTPGDPDHLTAFGTVEVTVLPILNPVEKLQKFPVFLISLIGLAGKAAADGPDHQGIGNRGQNQIHQGRLNEGTDETDCQSCAEYGHIQLVGAVAACHKGMEAGGELRKKLSEHKMITLLDGFFIYYIANTQEFNRKKPMFTDCFNLHFIKL